jgi:HSP20 family protein
MTMMLNPLMRRRRNPSTTGSALPWGLSSLQSEMDQLFENFGHEFPTALVYPSVDIEEQDEAVRVTAEVPGLSEKDIELEVAPSQDVLRLRGHKRKEETKNEKGYRSIERAYGSFQRDIALPFRVDPNQVKAKLQSGVLTVDLGKSSDHGGARRIEVKTH